MILAMLSGGIDSVAMCYMLLKQGNKLHIHHIEIENEENRTLVENIAVKNVLDYFTSIGLNDFTYTSSKISSPSIKGRFLYDSDAINFMAGFICNADAKIKSLAIGVNKEDLRNVGSVRIDRANQLFQLFSSIEKIYPIKDYSKKDLYEMLPQELKDTIWSCRTPIYSNNTAAPCGKCFTCIQMKRMDITQNSLKLTV